MIKISAEAGKKLLSLHKEIGQFFYFRHLHIEVLARPLTVAEVNTIEAMAETILGHIIHDWVCENSIIYCNIGLDQLLNDEKAGYVKSIAESILSNSSLKGETDFLSLLTEKRNKIKQTDLYLENFVMTAFKNLTVKDLRSLTIPGYTELLARAEEILGSPALDNGKKKKRGPIIPDGFTSIPLSKEEILSKDSANIVDSKTIREQHSI